ncbi:oxidoreductase [Streptomyces sp. NPDC001941]|uniref:oxidoreductase n=1 Tax=Streptomyces sp. NPDC001941 TaxID=3154659 RepID=UPI00331F5936
MSAEYATFALAPAVRPGGIFAGGGLQVHRDFLDFVVDGRPLLLTLSDLDAVSPLAADVPPAIFTQHVRKLLLKEPAPLEGGRYVLYGCPECGDLGCGAVTAVIERDGEDVVWRDFAWQTGRTVDLPRNGYPGMGPFRFRGGEYRAALHELLGAPGREPGRRRVLLVGARTAELARPAAALRTTGVGADVAADVDGLGREELRRYDAVVFGPGTGARERAAVRAALTAAGARAAYVDGPVRVLPVLLAQVEHALARDTARQRRLTALAARGGAAELDVAVDCRVRLVAYRVGAFSRVRTTELLDAELPPGRHRIPLDAGAVRGRSFVVARATGSVLVAPVVR